MRHILLSTLTALCVALPATGQSANKHQGNHRGGGGGGGRANYQVQRNVGHSNRVQRQYQGPTRQHIAQRSYNSRASYRAQRNYNSRSNYRSHDSRTNYRVQHNNRSQRSFLSPRNFFGRHNDRHWDHDDHRDRDHRHHHHYSRGYYPSYYYGNSYYGYGSPYYGYGYDYGYYPRSSVSVAYYSQPSYAYRGYEVDDGDSLAADVQRALQKRGYYRGYIDGQIGAGSRNAIAAYQADHGLSRTGRIDSRLLRSLDLD